MVLQLKMVADKISVNPYIMQDSDHEKGLCPGNSLETPSR